MIIHNTIRKYVGSLLNLFNDLEVQYTDSEGRILTKNIPIVYSTREKIHEFFRHTDENLRTGNANVLPRGNLAMSTMMANLDRQGNKNVKINFKRSEDAIEYMYNSVAWQFNFELAILCRGMNEACQVVEQVVPKFNPDIHLDIWDAEGLHEPSRIKINLLDVGIEQPDFEEYSTNTIRVNFGLSIFGQLYPPIKSYTKIQEFFMTLNTTEDKNDTVMGFDVQMDGTVTNPIILHDLDFELKRIDYLDGQLWCRHIKNKGTDLNFDWSIISDNYRITEDSNEDHITIEKIDEDSLEGTAPLIVRCEVEDQYGNFKTIQETKYNL